MTTLDDIASLAREYADARDELDRYADRIMRLRRRVIRARMGALKSRIAATAVARDALQAEIAANKHLFTKPKTRALHGIKVGLRQCPDKLTISDQGRSVALVREHLPEMAQTLIDVKESLAAQAVKKLPPDQRSLIGVRVHAGAEIVVISTASGDLDKLVDALLEDETDDSEREEETS